MTTTTLQPPALTVELTTKEPLFTPGALHMFNSEGWSKGFLHESDVPLIKQPLTCPIDGPTALRLLRQVVRGRENYCYFDDHLEGHGGCLYFEDLKPQCIVGHVLALLGVTQVAEQVRVMGMSWAFNDEAKVILQEAQRVQDAGLPWGLALTCAEHAAKRIGA